MVLDILVGKSSGLIPSLTEEPLGEDKFIIMRTAPDGFGRVIIPLNLAELGTLSSCTGPKAKPFFTQSAIASVTFSPFSKAEGALVALDGFLKGPLHPITAPDLMSLQMVSSSFLSGKLLSSASFFSILWLIRDLAGCLKLRGKFYQNSGGAAFP